MTDKDEESRLIGWCVWWKLFGGTEDWSGKGMIEWKIVSHPMFTLTKQLFQLWSIPWRRLFVSSLFPFVVWSRRMHSHEKKERGKGTWIGNPITSWPQKTQKGSVGEWLRWVPASPSTFSSLLREQQPSFQLANQKQKNPTQTPSATPPPALPLLLLCFTSKLHCLFLFLGDVMYSSFGFNFFFTSAAT